MQEWVIIWSPDGTIVHRVKAKTAQAAKRMTPSPWKSFPGEVYVQLAEENKKVRSGV